MELLELRVQSLLLDKASIVQNMERENQQGGWQLDWNEALRQVNEELQPLLSQMESL